MVYIYVNGSDRRLSDIVSFFEKWGIEYKVRKITEVTFTYGEFLRILECTVDGTDDILSTKSEKVRKMKKDGSLNELRLDGLYRMIIKDPTMLDLPLMVDDRGVSAVLGKGTQNLTVFLGKEMKKKLRLEIYMKEGKING